MVTVKLAVITAFSVKVTLGDIALQPKPLVTVTVIGLLAIVALIVGVLAPVDQA